MFFVAIFLCPSASMCHVVLARNRAFCILKLSLSDSHLVNSFASSQLVDFNARSNPTPSDPSRYMSCKLDCNTYVHNFYIDTRACSLET